MRSAKVNSRHSQHSVKCDLIVNKYVSVQVFSCFPCNTDLQAGLQPLPGLPRAPAGVGEDVLEVGALVVYQHGDDAADVVPAAPGPGPHVAVAPHGLDLGVAGGAHHGRADLQHLEIIQWKYVRYH